MLLTSLRISKSSLLLHADAALSDESELQTCNWCACCQHQQHLPPRPRGSGCPSPAAAASSPRARAAIWLLPSLRSGRAAARRAAVSTYFLVRAGAWDKTRLLLMPRCLSVGRLRFNHLFSPRAKYGKWRCIKPFFPHTKMAGF